MQYNKNYTIETLKGSQREKFLPREIFEKEVLSQLKYKNVALDYGAGVGYFTISLAKYFKKVYAVDIEEKFIAELEKEVKKSNLKNVEIILVEKNQIPKIDETLDFILFSNVLHEVDNFERFIEWSKVSKAVCVIEWNKKETNFGPKISERIEEKLLLEYLSNYFNSLKSLRIFPHHYVLVGLND